MIWIRRVGEYLKWVTFPFNEVQLFYYSVSAPLCRQWDPLPSCSAWDQPPLTCPAMPHYRGCPHPNSHQADLPSPTGWFNWGLIISSTLRKNFLSVPKLKRMYLQWVDMVVDQYQWLNGYFTWCLDFWLWQMFSSLYSVSERRLSACISNVRLLCW